MIDKIETGILNDYYGGMLTGHQQEAMRLYFDCDLSLSEISEELGITRQGVREILIRATGKLRGLEEKLGLVEKVKRIAVDLQKIIEDAPEIHPEFTARLDGLLQQIKEI